jgi:hypothetical protein
MKTIQLLLLTMVCGLAFYQCNSSSTPKNEINKDSLLVIEKEKKMLQQKQDSLKNVLTVVLKAKNYFQTDFFNQYIVFDLEITNNYAKDIQAFKGLMIVSDSLGTELVNQEVGYDDGIKSLQKIVWRTQKDFDDLSETDDILKEKKVESLQMKWQTQKIDYMDGSILE